MKSLVVLQEKALAIPFCGKIKPPLKVCLDLMVEVNAMVVLDYSHGCINEPAGKDAPSWDDLRGKYKFPITDSSSRLVQYLRRQKSLKF